MKTKRKGRSSERLRAVAKFFIITTCLAGFLYQTTEFFLLYLTYPTVVDIQVTSPSHIDMPSITICNALGYNLRDFCTYFKSRTTACYPTLLNRVSGVCKAFPNYCPTGNPPQGLQLIARQKFSQEVKFDMDDVDVMALPLQKYMECHIEYAGGNRSCNLETVLGPFYSELDWPNVCYSIYNHWGQPNKKRETIHKGSVMKLSFFLNATFRSPTDHEEGPSSANPASPAVQIGFHSPYYIPTPLIYGTAYIGGEKYEISLKQEEKHLLPAPYQTNCTDFMTNWRASGGRAPINQMGIYQECKMKANYEQFECVPLGVDYVHDYPVCRQCGSYNPKDKHCNGSVVDDCAELTEQYNQPCDFVSYEVTSKKKLITIEKHMSHVVLKQKEILSEQIYSHDCSGINIWKHECSVINIDVVFENFEINNLTYFPKYVSLELFSVIGGYMGMWLGVSLIAVYDFLEVLSRNLCTKVKNSRKKKRNKMWVSMSKTYHDQEKVSDYFHGPTRLGTRKRY